MASVTTSPRILYIAEACAFNVANGAQVRCLNVVRALQQIGKVEVVTLNDLADDARRDVEVESAIDIAYSLNTQDRSNKGLLPKLKWTFDPRTAYPRGYGVSDEGLDRISRHAKEFDLVWFYSHRCEGLFPSLTWPHSVLDVNDVLSSYERAALQLERGLLDRLLTARRMISWQRREKLLGSRFSVLATCSEQDKEYLKNLGIHIPIHVIPNGFERPSREPVRLPAVPPRIGFIGFLDYLPNRQGLQWFAEKCWPDIKREIPDARLRLVGTSTDGPLKPSGPDIDGLGWLTDPSDEIQTWSAMAVPVQMGAGTRVKIAHGFSQKCPIVSTSLGAHGYGAENGRELYLADSPDEFAKACIKAIREPDQAMQMAERAWHDFLEKWTWDALRPRVWAAVEDCLQSRTPSDAATPTSLDGEPQHESVATGK